MSPRSAVNTVILITLTRNEANGEPVTICRRAFLVHLTDQRVQVALVALLQREGDCDWFRNVLRAEIRGILPEESEGIAFRILPAGPFPPAIRPG